MYILISILLVICLLFVLFCLYKKKRIIRRVCCMEFCEKYELINNLAGLFGFSYCPEQDIITSRIDAFQKNFGYCSLYDKSALKFNMVLDSEPVYFDYADRTWLIELWKGQYGINIGAEIGIYYADTVLSPEQYDQVLFYGVTEAEMLPISMNLNYRGQSLFSINHIHWWLTGFDTGSYCTPEDLVLEVSITFPNEKMREAFLESLYRRGYHPYEISVCCDTVTFLFSIPHTRQIRLVHRITAAFAQWKNRVILRLYHFVTRPFTTTMDKILYLYFYLPAAFRHLLQFRKNRKQKLPPKLKKNIKKTGKKACVCGR